MSLHADLDEAPDRLGSHPGSDRLAPSFGQVDVGVVDDPKLVVGQSLLDNVDRPV